MHRLCGIAPAALLALTGCVSGQDFSIAQVSSGGGQQALAESDQGEAAPAAYRDAGYLYVTGNALLPTRGVALATGVNATLNGSGTGISTDLSLAAAPNASLLSANANLQGNASGVALNGNVAAGGAPTGGPAASLGAAVSAAPATGAMPGHATIGLQADVAGTGVSAAVGVSGTNASVATGATTALPGMTMAAGQSIQAAGALGGATSAGLGGATTLVLNSTNPLLNAVARGKPATPRLP